MSMVKHLKDDDFDAATSKGIALVDFWAEWCGPCRMLGPVIDQLATELGTRAVVAKVNVDEAQDLAARFVVRSIPAIFILKDGQIMKQFTGVQDKATLLKAVEEFE